NHVGRLGAYVQAAAAKDMIAIATCNSPIHGHFVVPWGGREGRLATNPLAYAAPTSGNPIVSDISTSIVPEGKIRLFKNRGKPLPLGWVKDANGQPTTDAATFYGPPMGGIMPLGGDAGHKGFALSLLVEILSSTLAGHDSTDRSLVGNGICFFVIDPSAFTPIDQFKKLMDNMIAYMKSSQPAPGFTEVLVPGELEFRTQQQRTETGIEVDDVTWSAIVKHARELKVRCQIDAI
ncbi:MAG: Ldh family oxidoreductase, partial [Planctomycetes bacterium]|nr:Ldh family oxidoreductase [Planctomycetota bacterium]